MAIPNRAHQQKNLERRRKRRSQFEHRIGDDVDHQRGPPPEFVGHQPEDERAYRPQRQRKKVCFQNLRRRLVKLTGERAHTEDKNEKIERVQRPAHETRDERVPLHRRQSAKVLKESHQM